MTTRTTATQRTDFHLMKHLPKHLRPRWRYLAVRIETWPDASLDRDAFQGALWSAARSLLGDSGSAAADLSVITFRHEDATGEAIVRARRGTTDDARAALACIDAIDGHRIGLRVGGVSGTVRACEEKYLGSRAEPSEERTVVFGSQERTAIARSPRVDVRDGSTLVGATESDLD